MASVTQLDLSAVIKPLGYLEPDEIAQLIKSEVGEHKAVCHEPSKCAIALYVAKKLNLSDEWEVFVSSYSTEVARESDLLLDYENVPRVWHPESVEDFIQAFDRKEYPDLIAPIDESID